MTDLTLYIYPGRNDLPSPSPPCCKVVLALAYSGLEHTVEPVKADPRTVSPTGRLPAIRIGDETVCDSAEILNRLEQLDPPQPFWPTDPRERARDVVWERFSNDHLYWRGVYLRWLVPENAKQTCRALLPKLPPIVRTILPIVAKREVRRRTQGQGIGLFSEARIRQDVVTAPRHLRGRDRRRPVPRRTNPARPRRPRRRRPPPPTDLPGHHALGRRRAAQADRPGRLPGPRLRRLRPPAPVRRQGGLGLNSRRTGTL